MEYLNDFFAALGFRGIVPVVLLAILAFLNAIKDWPQELSKLGFKVKKRYVIIFIAIISIGLPAYSLYITYEKTTTENKRMMKRDKEFAGLRTNIINIMKGLNLTKTQFKHLLSQTGLNQSETREWIRLYGEHSDRSIINEIMSNFAKLNLEENLQSLLEMRLVPIGSISKNVKEVTEKQSQIVATLKKINSELTPIESIDHNLTSLLSGQTDIMTAQKTINSKLNPISSVSAKVVEQEAKQEEIILSLKGIEEGIVRFASVNDEINHLALKQDDLAVTQDFINDRIKLISSINEKVKVLVAKHNKLARVQQGIDVKLAKLVPDSADDSNLSSEELTVSIEEINEAMGRFDKESIKKEDLSKGLDKLEKDIRYLTCVDEKPWYELEKKEKCEKEVYSEQVAKK